MELAVLEDFVESLQICMEVVLFFIDYNNLSCYFLFLMGVVCQVVEFMSGLSVVSVVVSVCVYGECVCMVSVCVW